MANVNMHPQEPPSPESEGNAAVAAVLTLGEDDHLLRLPAAARILEVAPSTLEKMIRHGLLPSVGWRGARRVLLSDLRTFVSSHRTVASETSHQRHTARASIVELRRAGEQVASHGRKTGRA